MNPVVRRVLSVIGGIVLAELVFNAIAAVGNRMYPVPDGAPLPVGAYLLILTGWTAAAGVGAYVSSEFSGRGARWPGMAVALLVTAASLLDQIPLHSAIWVSIVALVTVPAAGAAGTYLALRHPADAPPI